MTQRDMEVVIEKLKEAENLVLLAIKTNPSQEACSDLENCKVHSWKAMDAVSLADSHMWWSRRRSG